MGAIFTMSNDDQQVAAAANTPVAIAMGGDATPGFSVSGSKVTIKGPKKFFPAHSYLGQLAGAGNETAVQKCSADRDDPFG
jgi:hypothetical protein